MSANTVAQHCCEWQIDFFGEKWFVWIIWWFRCIGSKFVNSTLIYSLFTSYISTIIKEFWIETQSSDRLSRHGFIWKHWRRRANSTFSFWCCYALGSIVGSRINSGFAFSKKKIEIFKNIFFVSQKGIIKRPLPDYQPNHVQINQDKGECSLNVRYINYYHWKKIKIFVSHNQVAAFVDPLSTAAQRISPLLEALANAFGACVSVSLMPVLKVWLENLIFFF